MKAGSTRYLLTIFLDCFLVILAGFATFAYLMNLDLLQVRLLGFILTLSALLAFALTGLNFIDNRAERHKFEEDMDRLLKNEVPKDDKLKEAYQRISQMSAELQDLSREGSEERQSIIETERKRISRDLHDSVSQELFAATMILSSVTDNPEVSQEQMLSQTKLAAKILHEAQNEMRALLLHLRPVELDGKSLVSGLRGLIEELSAKISANISYKLTEVEAGQNIEDNLFRMAQEVLSNTLRHAEAQNIDIQLIEGATNLILRIEDDGHGFEESQGKTASYGLKNLRERAHMLAGEVTITTAPNQGTLVEIRIPKINENV